MKLIECDRCGKQTPNEGLNFYLIQSCYFNRPEVDRTTTHLCLPCIRGYGKMMKGWLEKSEEEPESFEKVITEAVKGHDGDLITIGDRVYVSGTNNPKFEHRVGKVVGILDNPDSVNIEPESGGDNFSVPTEFVRLVTG